MGNLAVIPARSGSKGIIDKNIRKLAGKPLLQYSIETAEDAGIFDCIHVSTDSQQYLELAGNCGADVPFLRNKELASDKADTWGVVRYVLDQYRCLGKEFEMVAVLQPTSPLRSIEDICGAYHLFLQKDALSVVSVCRENHSPLLAGTLDSSLLLDGFIDLKRVGRRQDMPDYYRVNGAIYMMKPCILEQITELYGSRSYAYVMPAERSVDIDTMIDFKIAEILMEEMKG